MVDVTERRWRWLADTRYLQTHSYGVDPAHLKGDELADFVTWNSVALIDELHEFLGEIRWKPWAGERGEVDRNAAIGELVDLLHFAANLLAAMGCTDDELETRYREKSRLNAKRMASGYDARNKCSSCGRALDDTSVRCTAERCADGLH